MAWSHVTGKILLLGVSQEDMPIFTITIRVGVPGPLKNSHWLVPLVGPNPSDNDPLSCTVRTCNRHVQICPPKCNARVGGRDASEWVFLDPLEFTLVGPSGWSQPL